MQLTTLRGHTQLSKSVIPPCAARLPTAPEVVPERAAYLALQGAQPPRAPGYAYADDGGVDFEQRTTVGRARRPLAPQRVEKPRDDLQRPVATILWLQATVGNSAVAAMIQRAGGNAGRDEKVNAALSASPPDAARVKEIDDFEGLSHDILAKLTQILVFNYALFFGPNDRDTLRKILTAFKEDLGVLANLKPFVFEKIMTEWPSTVMDVGPIMISANSFKTLIGKEAKDNLGANITYLDGEYKKLWGDNTGDPQKDLKSSQEQNQQAMAMTTVAGSLLKLRTQQKAMLGKVVGFKYVHNPFAPTQDVTFKPGREPDGTWHTTDDGQGNKDLNAQWALSSMLVGEHAAQYPWLFGILKDPENAESRLAELSAQKDPYQARVAIQQEMTKQINLAKDVQNAYKSSEPDWYDLVPVRNRVLDQKITGNFDSLVAKGVIAKRSNEEWWKKFAFTSVTDAALIVASFATAGMAPVMAGVIAGVVAAGIPGAQAYLASEKADDLSKADRGTVLPGMDLVSKMQVDALRAEALAKKIELLLTAIGLVGPLAAAARMELQLARLLELTTVEQQALIASTVLEKGGVYAAERTGLTLAELAARTGPDTAAGKKLAQEFIDLLTKGSTGLGPTQRAAIRDAGLTAAGTVADSLQDESQEEQEPDVIGLGRYWEHTLPWTGPGAAIQPTVQRAENYGSDFEKYGGDALLTGDLGLPKMNYVFALKHSPGDQGIDFIGLELTPSGFKLFQFECKYVAKVGGVPKLAMRQSGLQTGFKWTNNAVDLFLNTSLGIAVQERSRMLEAIRLANGGHPIPLDEIARMLKAAPVGYIVPDFAKVKTLQATIRGIARWRKVLKLYLIKSPIPD